MQYGILRVYYHKGGQNRTYTESWGEGGKETLVYCRVGTRILYVSSLTNLRELQGGSAAGDADHHPHHGI